MKLMLNNIYYILKNLMYFNEFIILKNIYYILMKLLYFNEYL